MHPQPNRRTTHAYGSPKYLLVYDRWGTAGRPVVLLHGLQYDRTMWWPVAADLADACTAIAVDLPGHGDSAPRDDYCTDRLTHDLAMLISRLDLRRAPILVGHGEAARVAERFAEKYATHAVIAVAGARLDEVPEAYRQFAVARPDPELAGAYRQRLPRQTTTPGQVDLGDCFPHLRDPAAFATLLKSVR
ncbi:alpha/beta fold hydrolase [Actinoplanes sp. G11-F43]|uniref:alpha/beta fold hydrolase n=1 Tax=Actinoplanes sp. G11-F43 TaxID=3424130 RepID=UPI003D34B87E